VAEKPSWRRGLYSIRGGDSLVTSDAIRVTVAGSASDRLGPARCACRRRTPTREPGRGDPRAAAAARRVQARQAPAASSPDRSRLLGRRLSRMVAMDRRARDREAGDRNRVAPPRFRPLLDVEIEAHRPTAARARDRGAHRANSRREPTVEPSPDRERLAKLGHDVSKDTVVKYMPKPPRRPLSRLLRPSVGRTPPRSSCYSPIVVVQTAEHGDVHDLSIAARRVRRAEWDELTIP
jgi:hypothetical protein